MILGILAGVVVTVVLVAIFYKHNLNHLNTLHNEIGTVISAVKSKV